MSKEILTWKRKLKIWYKNLDASKHISECGCCGGKWTWNKSHCTDRDESGGSFPLCEWCWSRLTIEQRLPYYHNLIDKQKRAAMQYLPIDEIDKNILVLEKHRKLLIQAVKEGK